ncbi:hypothetical protein PEX1_107420 [Penicillium expansum]|nr:hypothetical protein PEX1_107420 [Penicillium expansum]
MSTVLITLMDATDVIWADGATWIEEASLLALGRGTGKLTDAVDWGAAVAGDEGMTIWEIGIPEFEGKDCPMELGFPLDRLGTDKGRTVDDCFGGEAEGDVWEIGILELEGNGRLVGVAEEKLGDRFD